jgi:hypothetical protein
MSSCQFVGIEFFTARTLRILPVEAGKRVSQREVMASSVRFYFGLFVSALKIPFPGNGDFG